MKDTDTGQRCRGLARPHTFPARGHPGGLEEYDRLVWSLLDREAQAGLMEI